MAGEKPSNIELGFLPLLSLLFVEYLNHQGSDLSTLGERLFSSRVHEIQAIKCWPLPSTQFKRTSAVVHHCKHPASFFKSFWGEFCLCLPSHRGSSGVTLMCYHFWLFVDSWDPKSDAHTCMASTLHTEVKLLPFFPFFFLFCHGIVRTHKNLNNGSLKGECKKFGVLC